ncbi:MAG: cyclase family protein [Treponema sp.]|nr:cyclase family protein [Candidatus Treponema equifaecale]
MIYDITQPLFECEVFPGDPKPEKKEVLRISRGDVCNLTAFSMCAHNGTHVDAPFHFLKDGKGIDKISLGKFIGPAYVEKHDGDVSAQDAKEILERAKAKYSGSEKKILIAGNAVVTLEAAKIFADAGIDLVGNESQTVGPLDSPMAVHLVLLGAEIVLLEGIRLCQVPDGVYYLNCAPLNLSDTDGSPCRAVLLEMKDLNETIHR